MEGCDGDGDDDDDPMMESTAVLKREPGAETYRVSPPLPPTPAAVVGPIGFCCEEEDDDG